MAQRFEVLLRQFQAERGGILLDVLDGTGLRNRNRHAAAHRPGQRDRGRRHSLGGGDAGQAGVAEAYAASLILNGTGATPKTAFCRHDKSYVALLKIDGKAVRKVAQADVGDLAEGIALSPDGRYLYVGNFGGSDIDILRLDGDNLTKAANLPLPGHPASMRGSTS